MSTEYIGDVVGKPGTVACGECGREATREPNGQIPKGWKVASAPFTLFPDFFPDIFSGGTFWFECDEH